MPDPRNRVKHTTPTCGYGLVERCRALSAALAESTAGFRAHVRGTDKLVTGR